MATSATAGSSGSSSAEAGGSAGETPSRALLSRRLLGQALLPAAWSVGSAAALADLNPIIAQSRKEAAEAAKVKSVWNWNYYKRPTGNYDAQDLQEFLPTVFKARKQFEAILDTFDDPAVNMTDPVTHQLLREQNRIEPISRLRKESYRTKLWLRSKSKNIDTASNEYERVKRALDDEDAQLLLLGRTEDDPILPAAVRVAKRNVEDIIDAIDNLIKLTPENDQISAKTVADTAKLDPLVVFKAETLKKEKAIPDPAEDNKKEEPAKAEPATA